MFVTANYLKLFPDAASLLFYHLGD